MRTMLEQLRDGFALADTVTPGKCLDQLERELDAEGPGGPVHVALRNFFKLGVGATTSMILALVKERLAQEALDAISLDPPGEASRRANEIMRDRGLRARGALVVASLNREMVARVRGAITAALIAITLSSHSCSSRLMTGS